MLQLHSICQLTTFSPPLPSRPLGGGQDEGPDALSDAELLVLLRARKLRAYQLEACLGDPERAVAVRRQHVTEAGRLADALDELPHRGFEYERVMGACCENVVGYMPLPLGVVGPLALDGKQYYVPLATTEGEWAGGGEGGEMRRSGSAGRAV